MASTNKSKVTPFQAPAEKPGPGLGFKFPNDALASGPVDYSTPLEDLYSNVNGQTIIVTGGASGIGEACCRRLAMLGAHVAVVDNNAVKGRQVVASIERTLKEIGSARFFFCNVADYESQAQMFRDVLEWAPGGPRVINCVIVNAGVTEVGELIVRDDTIDPTQAPEPPNLTTFNVNYVGVLYTIRLAHHFLRHCPAGDRHLLIMGSFAAFLGSPLVPLYSSSKHGLLGLFTSIRLTSLPQDRIRVNMVSPYFVETPIMSTVVRGLLAGQQLIQMDQLTDSMVRLIGDERIAGRMVAVGPGMEEDVDVGGGLEEIETFSRRAVKVLNLKYNGPIFLARWGRILRDVILLVGGLLWASFLLNLRNRFGHARGRQV